MSLFSNIFQTKNKFNSHKLTLIVIFLLFFHSIFVYIGNKNIPIVIIYHTR